MLKGRYGCLLLGSLISLFLDSLRNGHCVASCALFANCELRVAGQAFRGFSYVGREGVYALSEDILLGRRDGGDRGKGNGRASYT